MGWYFKPTERREQGCDDLLNVRSYPRVRGVTWDFNIRESLIIVRQPTHRHDHQLTGPRAQLATIQARPPEPESHNRLSSAASRSRHPEGHCNRFGNAPDHHAWVENDASLGNATFRARVVVQES